MDKNVLKRRIKPTTECQYGKNCYSKNPHHFMEYAHEHLDNLINKNPSGVQENYDLPSDLALQKETVLVQLKMINYLFPNLKMQPQIKKEKNQPDEPKEVVASESKNKEDKKEIKETKTTIVQQKKILVLNDTSPSGPSTSEASVKIVVKQNTSNEVQARNIHDYIKVVLPKGKMAEKLTAAHPYNYFLTAITSSPSTHTEPLSITLQEIFDPSLGELESSVQINFMVDIGWLLGHHYFAGYLDRPLLVLYGSETPVLQTISKKKPQVTAHFVRMENSFATHHTKMMLLAYKDKSMRVVILTANLYEDDWHNRTQGLWMSPKLEALPDGADTAAGESPTEFRNDLLRYLTSYNIPNLQPWITRIRKSNFKAINVFLISSIPGTFTEGEKGYSHGLGRIAWLLSKYSAPIDDSVPVVAQCSSIGSLGADSEVWVKNQFLSSMSCDPKPERKLPPFNLIYPSFNNVIKGQDGMLGARCLRYGSETHRKQEWLTDYMYQWKSGVRHRSRAMPHIETFSRWSEQKLFWFILTSSNLSKAAWGAFDKSTKNNTSLRINNYEAGVLFLPRFITNTEYFSLDMNDKTTPLFPIPYDMPLIKYAVDDIPYLTDK